MPFTWTDILHGGVVPAVAAAVTAWVLGRCPPRDLTARYAAALGLALGFGWGYWRLELGPAVPATHWHWLPYAAAIAAGLGPVTRAAGVRWIERMAVFSVVSAILLWWLVPDWEDLDPSRSTHLAVCTAALVLIAAGVDVAAFRLPAIASAVVLMLVLACGSAVLALAGSLRFAQIAGAGAAACGGLALAGACDRQARSPAGIALPYAVLLGGSLLVGRVNSYSDVPAAAYLLVAAGAAAWGCCAIGPWSRWTGFRRVLVWSLPVLIAGAGVVLAALAESGGSEEEW